MSEMTNGRQVAVGSPPRRYSFYRSSPFTHVVTAGSKQATMRTTAVLTKQHSHVVQDRCDQDGQHRSSREAVLAQGADNQWYHSGFSRLRKA